MKKSNDFGQCGLVVALPSDEPRKWIQRVWNESDEVAIFEGMIDYIENGGDPYVDAAGFLDSIRESLHFDPTVKMLKCKICKLKTKYDNIAKKRRGGDDEDPVFARPHELKCYGLWKEIWGPNNSKSGSVGIRTRKKKVKTDSEMGEDANRELSSKVIKPDWSMFPCLTDLMGLDSDSFQALCTPGGRRVIEKGNLRAENVKAYLEWIDQLREKVMKIDKFLESSDSEELSE
ncbi:hypothetical protein Scep_009382 [Stephania cephalantha]|uniref:Glabrous enhancer-binding protein-like DBD domain-containing protein n=1 Tax=Stephania cephalantha TaxID=152367 RepID=A0AAP0JT18_9MAGN